MTPFWSEVLMRVLTTLASAAIIAMVSFFLWRHIKRRFVDRSSRILVIELDQGSRQIHNLNSPTRFRVPASLPPLTSDGIRLGQTEGSSRPKADRLLVAPP